MAREGVQLQVSYSYALCTAAALHASCSNIMAMSTNAEQDSKTNPTKSGLALYKSVWRISQQDTHIYSTQSHAPASLVCPFGWSFAIPDVASWWVCAELLALYSVTKNAVLVVFLSCMLQFECVEQVSGPSTCAK